MEVEPSDGGEKEEALNLRLEFEWVLRDEVHAQLRQLRAVLVECAHRFPVPLHCGNEGVHQQKFALASHPADNLRVQLTLTGDSVTHADIAYKRQPHAVARASILEESPWKLQQIQDAANHLQHAIGHIDNVDKQYAFGSADEVLHIAGALLGALQRARSALALPKKRPVEELMNGRNMKSLSPNLPEDTVLSIFIQSHKLVVVAYHVVSVHGKARIDHSQAECPVPWLNEVLWCLTSALQMCQQLKDKISVFSQYKDFTVRSRPPSALFFN